ncbi:putative quinol monooxygenase [Bradyrhizobium murdochi]|uniref:putative quinol monooxygenase n=1 Tax=Bradyrhizobium murdochi TaxID=1038859 RepID=UPI0004838701|nr:putative quinol monooxygenase [Bradyrhizobium murdochi]
MSVKQPPILRAAVLTLFLCGPALTQETQSQYVQLAELEIDPAQLESYKAAVLEQIDAAIRLEPGVLVLYAVSEKDNPANIRVFEIYRDADAYKSHLESAHFKKYKATTEKMVKSLKLVRTDPLMLGAKAK